MQCLEKLQIHLARRKDPESETIGSTRTQWEEGQRQDVEITFRRNDAPHCEGTQASPQSFQPPIL